MKLFGKEMSKTEKRELLVRFISVILSGIFAITLGVVSFAWFSYNHTLEHSGMEVTVSSEKVDILVDRTTEYDGVGYEGIVGVGGLKARLASENYDLTATETSVSPKLAYELVVEEATYEGKRYLMPGAYGTMTFYVRPKTGHDNESVRITLSLGGYADKIVKDENEQDVQVLEEVTNNLVKDLLKGHILFFTGRTGATYQQFEYSGLIEDGFTFDMSQHSKCEENGKTDCYKIVLYWEWPVTYFEITDHISTASPEVTRKYPAETATYLTTHPNYFFPVDTERDDEDGKSDAYNDGDQTIGDSVNYLVAYLNAL